MCISQITYPNLNRTTHHIDIRSSTITHSFGLEVRTSAVSRLQHSRSFAFYTNQQSLHHHGYDGSRFPRPPGPLPRLHGHVVRSRRHFGRWHHCYCLSFRLKRLMRSALTNSVGVGGYEGYPKVENNFFIRKQNFFKISGRTILILFKKISAQPRPHPSSFHRRKRSYIFRAAPVFFIKHQPVLLMCVASYLLRASRLRGKFAS